MKGSKWGKGIGVIMAILLVAMMAAACSGNKEANNQPAESPTQADNGNGKAGQEETQGEEAFDYYRYKEPVEITIVKDVPPDLKLPEGETIEDNSFSRFVKKHTNIDFKVAWYATGQDFVQKQQLAIASNDIPDVMLVDETTFRQLAAAEQLEDLTEVYNKYAQPQLKSKYEATQGVALAKATYDGKLMALPNLSGLAESISLLWVRQDWLDKLNIPAPKTADDVEAIAKAFVQQDPNGNNKADTVGLTGSGASLYSNGYAGMHDFTGLFAGYNAYPGLWLKGEGDSIVYGSTTPETKATIAKLRGMYANGLIDKEFALRKDPNQLVSNGEAGMFFGPWWAPWNLSESITNDPAADWKPYWIADAEGKLNTHMVPISSHFVVVKKGFKHPDAVMTYINWYTGGDSLKSEDEKERARAQQRLDDFQALDPTLIIALYPLYTTYVDTDVVEKTNIKLKKAISGEIKPEDMEPGDRIVYEQWQRDNAKPKSNAADWPPPYAYLNGGDAVMQPVDRKVFNEYTATTKTMQRKWANLQKLETETMYKIIMGEEPLEAFDTFVEKWKSQGGNEIIAEIEAELSKQK
ncbi:extracellular solute-binding protein [Paenibacillus eucommiae]|uniref:Aldouronate transport system substrate-binding protein n=1 Tax=Paenibacillus eucommiae TaxID=1355755 RepID=A0ABS4ISF9_9BACL|nr:extracellular solute-binding protein [Paenibacillus eucommiae]MBP1990501.1 putative aldouronate transport system substrate-binding protein [Paenibacillus eucommiae]